MHFVRSYCLSFVGWIKKYQYEKIDPIGATALLFVLFSFPLTNPSSYSPLSSFLYHVLLLNRITLLYLNSPLLAFSSFWVILPIYSAQIDSLTASSSSSNASVSSVLPWCPQAIMAQLPQEEKAKIAEQVESFRQEKCKLDAEVAKWDDNGNDIIVLAKQMCMIMMEMTDFTR